MNNAVDQINLRTMRSPEVVGHYTRPERLLPHERVALDRVAHEVRGEPILDIGVGGGRTVPALMEVSNDYLGVDYSTEMIAACRHRFPGVRFEHADARRLSNVRSASIQLAVFSCNGISMVGNEDRLAILREVFRVLRPGGIFLFTTYNRDSPEASAGFQWPEFQWSSHPVRLLVRFVRLVRDIATSAYRRNKHLRHEVHSTGYAVLNDKCHNYGVMLYYITLSRQRVQLEQAGFEPDALAFDSHGQPITSRSTLDSMALIARKR